MGARTGAGRDHGDEADGFRRAACTARRSVPPARRRPLLRHQRQRGGEAARQRRRDPARGIPGRDRDHRRVRADRLLERGGRGAVRPRALARARPGARRPDLPRPPPDLRPRGAAARGRRARRGPRSTADRACRAPGRRTRDSRRHRHQADRARRLPLARRLPRRRQRAQRARARAPRRRAPAVGRPRPRPGRARGNGHGPPAAAGGHAGRRRARRRPLRALAPRRRRRHDDAPGKLRLASGGRRDCRAARDLRPARVHAAAGPGRDRRRGLPARGPLRRHRARGGGPDPELDLDPHPRLLRRVRLARRRLGDRPPLRAQRHQPVRLAGADARRRDRAHDRDRVARRGGAADPNPDRAPALDHLPRRARLQGRVVLRLSAGRGDHRLDRRGGHGRPPSLGAGDAPRRPRVGARGGGPLRHRGVAARHRLPGPQARWGDDLGPRPGLRRHGQRRRRHGRRGPDHRHQRAEGGRGPAPLPRRTRRAHGPDEPSHLRVGRQPGARLARPAGRARRDGDHRPRPPEAGQRHARAQHRRSRRRRHLEDALR